MAEVRSTYFKQLAQKQKEDPTSHEREEAKEIKSKEELSTRDDGMLATRKKSFTESATVKSLRLKIQQKKNRAGSANEEESKSKLITFFSSISVLFLLLFVHKQHFYIEKLFIHAKIKQHWRFLLVFLLKCLNRNIG